MDNKSNNVTRRSFITTAVIATACLKIPASAMNIAKRPNKPLTIGIITDLHHDIMHDGEKRLGTFLNRMKKVKPDAILQMGDFAYPAEKNRDVINMFNNAHPVRMHVIGNHDTDGGHTPQQCLDYFGMPSTYYTQKIGGVWFIVLNGNEKGSPAHKGGYPCYIGPEQVAWLKQKLAEITEPIIIISHQPLAGEFAVDNADEIQDILSGASDKILLAINGHTHVNCILRKKDISYLHINSASYFWVGDKYTHETYSPDIIKGHPFISKTCPYKDALFTTMHIDPDTLDITFDGINSEWVGKSPAALGYDEMGSLTIGEGIAPKINDREILKVKKR
jgi:Icc protein